MALSETASLLVKVTADIAGAKGAFNTLSGQIDGLRGTVLKAAAAIGGAFALRDVIQSTRDWNLGIIALSDTLGVGAQTAAQYAYQAKIVGTTADDIATSVGVLSKKIFDDIPLIEQHASAFDKLGVSVLDAGGNIRPFEDILANVRERISQLGPGLASAAAERELFGRSGGKLNEWLMLTDDQLKAMNADMDTLGLNTGLSAEQMKASERNWNSFGMILESIKIALGNYIIPLFLRIVPSAQQASSAVKSFGEALRVPLTIIKMVIDRLVGFIDDVKSIGFAGAIGKLIQDVVSAIGTELEKLGPIGQVAKDAILVIAGVEVLTKIATVVSAIANISATLSKISPTTLIVIDVVLVGVAINEVLDLIDLIGSHWEQIRRAAKDGTIQQQGWMGIFLAYLVDAGNRQAAFGAAVSSTFSLIVGAIGKMFSDLGAEVHQRIYDLTVELDILIGKINATPHLGLPNVPTIPGGPVFVPTPVNPFLPPPGSTPGSDATGNPIWFNPTTGQIGPRMFAAGGIATRPTAGIFGEAGPEALIPLDRMPGLGGGVTVNFHAGAIGSVDSVERVREVADAVANVILGQMRMRRQSVL